MSDWLIDGAELLAEPDPGPTPWLVDGLIVDQAIFHTGRRPADAARAEACRLARGGRCRRASRLGHRPGFDDRDAVTFLEGGAVADIDAERSISTTTVVSFSTPRG